MIFQKFSQLFFYLAFILISVGCAANEPIDQRMYTFSNNQNSYTKEESIDKLQKLLKANGYLSVIDNKKAVIGRPYENPQRFNDQIVIVEKGVSKTLIWFPDVVNLRLSDSQKEATILNFDKLIGIEIHYVLIFYFKNGEDEKLFFDNQSDARLAFELFKNIISI